MAVNNNKDRSADADTRSRTAGSAPEERGSRASGDIPVLLTLNVLTGERGEADAIALVARKSDEKRPG